jgi:hypothetical protein
MWTFPASVTQSGAALPQEDGQPVSGEIVRIGGEAYYCIHRYDQMPPFFMSIVSSADHWLFISSTGGLTAGRVNAESALFPYYTDDKVAENWVNTGPVTCLFVRRAGMANAIRWEPFSADQGETQRIERNLYKSVTGDKLIFEEVNLDLGLTFRYAWRTSDRFGFVRTAWLQNNLEQPCTVQVLDGVRNLLPYGATTSLQTNMSNLLDAYKRSELDPATGLGLFALSATLTDRAEPSESLRATTVWQIGLAPAAHLLSTSQLTAFRRGQPITQELDIKGERGAYLVTATLELAGQTTQSWSLLADVNQDHSQIAALRRLLAGDRSALAQQVEVDITQGSTDLGQPGRGCRRSPDHSAATDHGAPLRKCALQHHARRGVFVNNAPQLERDDSAGLRARSATIASVAEADRAACRVCCTARFVQQALWRRQRAAGIAQADSTAATSTCRSPSAVGTATRAARGTAFPSTRASDADGSASSTTRATGATSSRTGRRWCLA